VISLFSRKRKGGSLKTIPLETLIYRQMKFDHGLKFAKISYREFQYHSSLSVLYFTDNGEWVTILARSLQWIFWQADKLWKSDSAHCRFYSALGDIAGEVICGDISPTTRSNKSEYAAGSLVPFCFVDDYYIIGWADVIWKNCLMIAP
jgi:hypothetical protein